MHKYKRIRLSRTQLTDEHRIVAGCVDAGFNIVVHHKNGDTFDNRLENLEIMTRGEHVLLHGTPGQARTFEPDENGYAVCRKCGKKKHISEFARERGYKCGYRSECKICYYARKRRNYQERNSGVRVPS